MIDENVIEFSEKLLFSYDSLVASSDATELLSMTLFSMNHYNYSVDEANRFTNRQGKNRSVYDHNSRPAEVFELDNQVDYIEDSDLSKLMISSLNYYLHDKQELPASPKFASGITNRVKSLVIMLFHTNQYGIIPSLDLPSYVVDYVSKAFKLIQLSQDETIDAWVSYLSESENDKMLSITRSIGNEFWGLPTIKTTSLFSRYFKGIIAEINDYTKTYETFKFYRNEYFTISRSTALNKLYPIFEMTADEYSSAKRAFIRELPNTLRDDEANNLLYKLIYGD